MGTWILIRMCIIEVNPIAITKVIFWKNNWWKANPHNGENPNGGIWILIRMHIIEVNPIAITKVIFWKKKKTGEKLIPTTKKTQMDIISEWCTYFLPNLMNKKIRIFYHILIRVKSKSVFLENYRVKSKRVFIDAPPLG